MSLYNELLKEQYPISAFDDDFTRGRVSFNGEGKISEVNRISKDIYWIPTNMEASPTDRRCNIFLDHIFGKLGFVHSFCYDCYKVVARPKTVVQLFKMLDLQKEMNLPSKCGVEVRSFVPHYYGAYWYTRSIEEGQEVYHRVRTKVDYEIDKGISIVLKRACTEYEMEFGDSSKWEMPENQAEKEKEFEEIYTRDLKAPYKTPSKIEAYIKSKWIVFAATQKIPDMTYLELTDGKPLVPHVQYKTYHSKPLIKVVK